MENPVESPVGAPVGTQQDKGYSDMGPKHTERNLDGSTVRLRTIQDSWKHTNHPRFYGPA